MSIISFFLIGCMGIFIKLFRRMFFTHCLFSDFKVNARFIRTLHVLFMFYTVFVGLSLRTTSFTYMTSTTSRAIFIRGSSSSARYRSNGPMFVSTCRLPSDSWFTRSFLVGSDYGSGAGGLGHVVSTLGLVSLPFLSLRFFTCVYAGSGGESCPRCKGLCHVHPWVPPFRF